MVKGDIVEGQKTEHPIVFMGKKNVDEFYGLMLTRASSYKYPRNVKLEPAHIEQCDEAENEFPFQYNNTHFGNLLLEKQNSWGPFTKVGQLSQGGLEFVEERIDYKNTMSWDEYLSGLAV